MVFHSDNLAWMVKKEKRDAFQNNEIQTSLYKPIEVKADRLWTNTKQEN